MAEWVQKYEKIKTNSSDDLRSKILKIRGVPEDKHVDFLAPDESFVNDYRLMRGITRSAKLFVEHINKGSNILWAGDPDADGVTSTAIGVLRTIEICGEENVDYIYPQRDMGHGISGMIDENNLEFEELISSNIEKIKKSDLIIIVDSSSNDIDGIKKLKEIKPDIDIIILDHHEFNDLETEKTMSKLVDIVNPQHSKDEYPNKHLSGAGVVYKFCKAVDDLIGDDVSDKYLDLVAVGLIGDMMNVLDLENRYYISKGLQDVHNVGLSRILKGAKVNLYKYNSKDIGFSVAPLINASARMGEIDLAFKILMVDNDKDAKPLRLKMDKLNKKRQELQKEIADKYIDSIDTGKKIIIIVDKDSNKGFNGLVAQNIAQRYQRPCFVVREHDGMCMGSGRSFGGFNTKDFLSELDWVETSGHAESHGLNFPSDKLEELEEYIENNIDKLASRDVKHYYDVEIGVGNIWYDIEDIQSLNYITGSGFPEIVVKISDVMINERNVIGKTMETVKFSTSSDLVLIKFKVNELWNRNVDTFDSVDVIGTPTINEFYNFATRENTRTPQLIIKDIVKI